MAVELLKKETSPAEVLESLCTRFHLSSRQAYRYLRQAEALGSTRALPERKVVFTVKLPRSLSARVRRVARRQKQPISGLVTLALEAFLQNRNTGSHG